MSVAALAGRSRRRARMLRAAQLVATVALLVLIWNVAGGGAAALLRAAHPAWLTAAVVLLMMLTLLSALRWRVAAVPLGIRLTSRRAIGESFLAQLLNTTLPGGVMGDVGRAARSRHDVGGAAAAGAVVVERLLGQLGMLAVLSAGFVLTLVADTGIRWPLPVLIVLAASLPAAWAVVALVLLRTRRATRAPGRLMRALRGLRSALGSRGAPAKHAALSAGTSGCVLGAFACCAAAVGAPLSGVAVVAVVPLVLLAMLVPLSVAGWGVREGAAVALLPIAGISTAQAFAVSVAFGLAGLVAALPGFAALWARRRRGGQADDTLAAGAAARRCSASDRFETQESP